jgi:hypothetical protein
MPKKYFGAPSARDIHQAEHHWDLDERSHHGCEGRVGRRDARQQQVGRLPGTGRDRVRFAEGLEGAVQIGRKKELL